MGIYRVGSGYGQAQMGLGKAAHTAASMTKNVKHKLDPTARATMLGSMAIAAMKEFHKFDWKKLIDAFKKETGENLTEEDIHNAENYVTNNIDKVQMQERQDPSEPDYARGVRGTKVAQDPYEQDKYRWNSVPQTQTTATGGVANSLPLAKTASTSGGEKTSDGNSNAVVPTGWVEPKIPDTIYGNPNAVVPTGVRHDPYEASQTPLVKAPVGIAGTLQQQTRLPVDQQQNNTVDLQTLLDFWGETPTYTGPAF